MVPFSNKTKMTEMFPKKSSLHLFRPHSASRLKSDENVKFVGSKTRPSSAHPNPTSHEDVKAVISYPLDLVASDDEDSPQDNYRRTVNKKKKKRKVISDPNTAVEVWLEKRKTCTDVMHPFVNISLHNLENSDEYDTDIEEELVDTARQRPVDFTGEYSYKDKCLKSGIVPVSFVIRNIGKRCIKIRHHYIGSEGVKPLADALKVNTVTEYLDLCDNYLESKGAYYVANMMLDNLFIISLNLSNNFIETKGIVAVSHMIQLNTTLKTLYLAGNQLHDREAMILVEGLKHNDTLTSLDISNNNIGELGGIHIGNLLATNEGINDLDLSWNCIRGKGALSIIQALKTNTVLEVLDVSWNGFGLEGCIALQKYLPVNTKLIVLDLTNNRISVECAKRLAIGLKKNSVLKSINLNQNAMKDEGVEAILKAVMINSSLKLLSLENCAEIGLNMNNARLIQDISINRDITILHGGTGGYQRNTAITSILNIFRVYLQTHYNDIQSAFQFQDKEQLGILNSDEIRNCLKEHGLRMTNRMLDSLLEELDKTNTGNIIYRDLLNIAFISDHVKRRSVDHTSIHSEMGR